MWSQCYSCFEEIFYIQLHFCWHLSEELQLVIKQTESHTGTSTWATRANKSTCKKNNSQWNCFSILFATTSALKTKKFIGCRPKGRLFDFFSCFFMFFHFPCQPNPLIFPVFPVLLLSRHAACPTGSAGCSSEESSCFRSSPALCRKLLFVQPETQAGSAAASGRSLPRQVRHKRRLSLLQSKFQCLLKHT